MGLGERLQHAWNAFKSNNKFELTPFQLGGGYNYRPDQIRFNPGTERSIVTAVYNRIAIDVSSIKVQHVRLDQNGRYKEVIDDSLNQCLTVSANIDQTGRAMIQDIVMTLCDSGIAAVVPVETTTDPSMSNAYSIESIRVGEITQWYPEHVQVRLYNEKVGAKQEVTLPKSLVAIVENPLYAIMNAPNSTLRRLIRKLAILDAIDEQSGSGKLDLIIQLPYVVKTPTKRAQAEQRRKDIEMQLAGSKYGIAYTDGTEHITQLNRSVDNNLMSQIEYLTKMLYSQLGITEEVMNGTADEQAMLNYHNRTIEPMLSAITEEMYRKFLTKTARTQGQSITFFRDPFKLVPVNNIADIADKFTRNEILSSNEVRAIIGYKPVDDPRADELRNKNLNQNNTPMSTDDEVSQSALEHHGVKGQKWGVQNGPPYPLNKTKINKTGKYTKQIRTLIDSLTDTQRNYIGDGYWIDKNRTVYRNVIGDKNNVDAFLDVYNLPKEHNGEGTVVLAVSNEKSGQGYATQLARQLVKDYESGSFGNGLSNLIWRVDEGNTASDIVALKAGFVFEGTEEDYGEVLNVYKYYKSS